MDQTVRKRIEQFVQQHIVDFHVKRTENLTKLKLNALLENKNPYLFKAKNLNFAPDLIKAILAARLSSSEEGSFGIFMEELAIFVAQITGGGQKSGIKGIDIELMRGSIRYLVAVKSGQKWGNTQSRREQRENFRRAVQTIKQSKRAGPVQPTLGICYGKFKTRDNGEFLHIGGQSFWHLLSGDPEFYVDVVEPLGYEAEKHDETFELALASTTNRLIREFTVEYCDESGAINWHKLVRFVSENLPKPEQAGPRKGRKKKAFDLKDPQN